MRMTSPVYVYSVLVENRFEVGSARCAVAWAEAVRAVDGAVRWEPLGGEHTRLPLQIVSVWIRDPTLRGSTVPAVIKSMDSQDLQCWNTTEGK